MKTESDLLYHSININKDKCIACSHCIKVCPTEALHIWDGYSNMDVEKCIDCDECYRACPVGAIEVKNDGFEQVEKFDTKVLLIPSVFMGQFPVRVKSKEVFLAVQELGFDLVYEVEESSWLVEKIIEEKINNKENTPIISSFCPAVLRLIQVQYPLLAENIINIQTPVDITATSIRKKMQKTDMGRVGIFYLTPCSAKITALKAPIGEKNSVLDGVLNMQEMFNKVSTVINKNRTLRHRDKKQISNNAIKPEHIQWSLAGGEIKNLPGTCLSIDGVRNVISFLDRIETQGCNEIDFLEMKNCDQGCAGGILTPQNRFLTAHKLRERTKYYHQYYHENPDKTPINHTENLSFKDVKTDKIQGRSIVKYSSDPLKAFKIMEAANKLKKQLPGLDCGACGYPTCRSLADNIAENKAKMSYCFVIQRKQEAEKEINAEKNSNLLRMIWGRKKFIENK